MRARSLATNSGLAFAGDLASKIGLLLVVVLAARALSTGELAILGTALAVSGIAAVCLDGGAGLLITRDGARNERARDGLLSALLLARMPAAVLVVVAASAVGAAVDAFVVWSSAAVIAVLGALTVSLIGYFRAGRDMRPEAVQKLVFALLALVLTGVAVVAFATAGSVLLAMVGANLFALVLLAVPAARALRPSQRVGALAVLRRALPLGLMAIATVIYYRSGTVALAVLSTPAETAAYTVASAVGFGLLMLPNAITTGLLPHLSAAEDGHCAVSTRRALRWSIALSAPIAAAFALGGYVLLGPVFGAGYADAAAPLTILCAAVVVIAYNGVLGTALLAAGHVGVIVLQVACSLAVNIVALVALAPALGAVGAATATLLCEVVAAVMLTVASARRLPSRVVVPSPAVPTAS
jgi:O-antigen/teichoic acid export membrane protein